MTLCCLPVIVHTLRFMCPEVSKDGVQAHCYTGILVELMGVLHDSAEGWMRASQSFACHMHTIECLEISCFDPITPEVEAALVAKNAAMVSF